jgi:hypothetical protein
MGKVSYAAGIDYVQGSLAKPKKVDGHSHGSYLIGTHRTAATTNPDCTRLYVRKSDVYKRSTPVTADEILNRQRFATVSAAVATRAKDLTKMGPDKAAFQEQKDTPGGLKTLKSYLWSLEMATYDQAHQG